MDGFDDSKWPDSPTNPEGWGADVSESVKEPGRRGNARSISIQ
jgi:hypothetical protein